MSKFIIIIFQLMQYRDSIEGLFGVSERGGVMWVQGSHSLGEKAVEQSSGAGSDTPVPSSWG